MARRAFGFTLKIRREATANSITGPIRRNRWSGAYSIPYSSPFCNVVEIPVNVRLLFPCQETLIGCRITLRNLNSAGFVHLDVQHRIRTDAQPAGFWFRPQAAPRSSSDLGGDVQLSRLPRFYEFQCNMPSVNAAKLLREECTAA